MSIHDQLMADLKTALRDQDELRKTTIRMTLAALKNARVDKNADLTNEETIAVLNKEVKQRRDSVIEYEKGERDDLVARELAEVEILRPYLPQMLDEDEITELAREVITATGASSPKEIGQVMRALMPRVKGMADGRLVNQVVKKLLTQ